LPRPPGQRYRPPASWAAAGGIAPGSAWPCLICCGGFPRLHKQSEGFAITVERTNPRASNDLHTLSNMRAKARAAARQPQQATCAHPHPSARVLPTRAAAFTAAQASAAHRHTARLLIETDMCPNRLVAHITLDDSVALDVGKVCFAVGWRKG